MLTNNSSLLKNALFANSAFCFTSGLAFVLFSGAVASFLGLSAPRIVLILGAVLMLYGVEVFYFARKEQISRAFATFVIGADIAWVLASAMLVFTKLVAFTTAGTWAIALVADIVLVFAIVQTVGLRRLAKQNHS